MPFPNQDQSAHRILGYSEDFPAAESVVSYGMSRVNGRLFQCLQPEVIGVALNHVGYWWKDADLHPAVKAKRHTGNKMRRLFRWIAGHSEHWADALLSFWIHLGVRVKKEDIIFCPCGADPAALLRALRIAEIHGLHLVVYLVDDFESSHQLTHGKQLPIQTRDAIRAALDAASMCFVISEGLQDLVATRYGAESVILPLPYPQVSTPTPTPDESGNQILFVGNPSHFYQDGLKDLVKAIMVVNSRGANLKLRITLGRAEEIKALLGDVDFIQVGPAQGSETLEQMVASSAACFLPYSFQAKYRMMVETSFPSKLLDYLAFGRHIICQAPGTSTSARYFQKHELPYLVTTSGSGPLVEVLGEILKAPTDHAPRYRKVLRENHSLPAVRAILVNALSHAT